jgi:hypothetical protein
LPVAGHVPRRPTPGVRLHPLTKRVMQTLSAPHRMKRAGHFRSWNGRGLSGTVPGASTAWMGSSSSHRPFVCNRFVRPRRPPSIPTWRAPHDARLIMPDAGIRRGSLPTRREESLDRPRAGFRWQVMRRRDALGGHGLREVPARRLTSPPRSVTRRRPSPP